MVGAKSLNIVKHATFFLMQVQMILVSKLEEKGFNMV